MRRGAEAWLVSSRGRVIRRLNQPRLSSLPRIWVPITVTAAAGDTLADPRRFEPSARWRRPRRKQTLPARVSSARSDDGELTLVLAAGTMLELADEEELALKLAVARQVLLALKPTEDGWPAYST